MANLSEDLEIIVEKIQGGTFLRTDILSLLISVRYAQPRSPILEELGDFVAHRDERTKGISYNHINNFISKFVDFAMSGGSIKIPEPIFSQEKVVSALIKVAQTNKIFGFKEPKFRSQAFNIMVKILEIVSETKIKNTRVANCRFSAVEKNNNNFIVFFCFGPIEGGLINVKKEVKIPAFVATSD
ncbi:MAG: hypothetical protein WC397_01545 [Candidatus Paceibacterota bacterium]|jgi:hypothetical protein